jgi:hypothetical protein
VAPKGCRSTAGPDWVTAQIDHENLEDMASIEKEIIRPAGK